MKRFKEYNPQQTYLISLNPEETFPSCSFENFIVSIMEKIVDEDEFYPEKLCATILFELSKGNYATTVLEEIMKGQNQEMERQ